MDWAVGTVGTGEVWSLQDSMDWAIGKIDKIPFWHFFFPLPALVLMVYRTY